MHISSMPSPAMKEASAVDDSEQPVHSGKLLLHVGDPRDPSEHGTWSQQYIVLYPDVIEYGLNKKLVKKVYISFRLLSRSIAYYNMNINRCSDSSNHFILYLFI